MVDAGDVARRFGVDREVARALLVDFEAKGWARFSEFADLKGWSVTESGRVEDERRLAVELGESGVRAAVAEAHHDFLPLNARFLTAITNWQIRPLPWDPMAGNDHTDFRWDDGVLDDLAALGRGLQPICAGLAEALDRFDGYAGRFSAALEKVERGDRSFVDQIGIDSCHTVWFELHEDLTSTLGIEPGQDVSPLS